MRAKTLAVLALALASSSFALENATLSVSKIKDLNVRIYGFVETDVIHDTTQGFTEEQGNNLIPTRTPAGKDAPAAFAGQNGRTIMSVRNSRLGFELGLPKTEKGVAAKAVIELDFLGNNATNAAPGSAPGAQTERDFFNNPAVRVRHAYVDLTYGIWDAKLGQTWSLLGWQPYYFPGEAVVQPGPGQLYRRFAQARVTNTLNVLPDWTLETALGGAKPAEMNSGDLEWQGGARVASAKWKAASIGGSGTSMVGLSAGVSGAAIPTRTNGAGNPTGTVYALDVAVPIIPSVDGKDRKNNLIAMGEFMSGSGVGGLEFSGLTLGVSGVTAASKAGAAIDSGIAGLNASGDVELVKYRTFRGHVQYTLNDRWSLSAGYAQVEGRNLSRFSLTPAGSATLAPKIQFGYVAAFYDPLAWLRFAAEVNQTKDTYNDPFNRYARNTRSQLSAYFIF